VPGTRYSPLRLNYCMIRHLAVLMNWPCLFQCCRVASHSHEREVKRVHVVLQVKHLGEAGAREVIFMPAAVRLLRGQQIVYARTDRFAMLLAGSQQSQQGPGGL